jgi:hypothetical protein
VLGSDLKILNEWHVIPIGIEDTVSSIVEKSLRSKLLPSGRLLDCARSDLLREF